MQTLFRLLVNFHVTHREEISQILFSKFYSYLHAFQQMKIALQQQFSSRRGPSQPRQLLLLHAAAAGAERAMRKRSLGAATSTTKKHMYAYIYAQILCHSRFVGDQVVTRFPLFAHLYECHHFSTLAAPDSSYVAAVGTRLPISERT
jgi:hypothetical protein